MLRKTKINIPALMLVILIFLKNIAYFYSNIKILTHLFQIFAHLLLLFIYVNTRSFYELDFSHTLNYGQAIRLDLVI